MSAFVQTNNNFSTPSDLINFLDYYNLMQGNWTDGTPITYGGNGFGGNEASPYMFSGEPSDANDWSECSENMTANDRRYLMSCGPFSMEVGERKSLTIGVYWLRFDEISVCPSVREVFEDVSSLADAHHQNLTATSSNDTFFETENKMLEVWPNPATDFLNIKYNSSIFESKNTFFRLFDVQGKIVFSKKIETNENVFSIDVSKFETGIYTYQFLGEKMEMEVGKVLVLE